MFEKEESKEKTRMASLQTSRLFTNAEVNLGKFNSAHVRALCLIYMNLFCGSEITFRLT